MNREPRENSSFDIDYSKPIEEDIMKKEDVCFGKMWDLSTSDCSKCADREICGIVFNDRVVKPKADKLEEELGSKYLDKTDFEPVTDELLLDFVVSGETTVAELLKYVGTVANTDEKVAIVEHVKRFIKRREDIYTKDGLVWIR